MPFSYFNKLNAKQKKIYLQSDAISSFSIPHNETYKKLCEDLRIALSENNLQEIKKISSKLCALICEGLKIDPVEIRIKNRRPSNSKEELQGLYVWEAGKRAYINIWMLTSKKGRVVAYKTFLRTILHEVCHHLDYFYFKLEDSFHTEGFFKRESQLFKLLTRIPAGTIKKPKKTAYQMELFTD